MKSIQMLFTVAVVIFLGAVASSVGAAPPTKDRKAGGCNYVADDGLCSVSLIAVLASPERYNLKRIQVEGFASQSGNGFGVFATDWHSRVADKRSALWLETVKISMETQGELHGRAVLIEGTFVATNFGPGGEWGGTLSKVERAVALVPPVPATPP